VWVLSGQPIIIVESIGWLLALWPAPQPMKWWFAFEHFHVEWHFPLYSSVMNLNCHYSIINLKLLLWSLFVIDSLHLMLCFFLVLMDHWHSVYHVSSWWRLGMHYICTVIDVGMLFFLVIGRNVFEMTEKTEDIMVRKFENIG